MSDSFVTPWTYSPPGSSGHGISQARILELPFSSPGDLPNPGIETACPVLGGRFFTPEPPGKFTAYYGEGKFPLVKLLLYLYSFFFSLFLLYLWTILVQKSKNLNLDNQQYWVSIVPIIFWLFLWHKILIWTEKYF